MKIGIMTWFSYPNYGTFLQATAMEHYLKTKGFDVALINYLPDNKFSYQKESLIKNFLKRVKVKYEVLFGGNYPYIETISGKQFTLARDKFLHFTKLCDSDLVLNQVQSDFDAVICGSDQIWSPNCFDPNFFLGFVADTDKMIAYAPSFGVSKIFDDCIADKIRTLVDRFNFLSIREKAGAEIIRELTGRNVPIVADPTLLLTKNEWIQYLNISLQNRNRYILVYFLGYSPKNWNVVYNICHKLDLPIKIIPVSKKDLKRKGALSEGVSPDNFVELIANAEYICTDSFHGTVFSLIFQKQFTCFERFKGDIPENQNSRIYSILDLLELRNCLYHEGQACDPVNNINYDNVEVRLARYREESMAFLERALQEIARKKEKDKE